MEIENDPKSSEDEEEDDNEDIFEVEKIVGISTIDGKEMYKVRWEGYNPSYDTWEPYENLMSCVDMIDAYKKQQQEKAKKKKDEAVKRRMSGPKFEYIEDDETTLKDTFWEDLKDGKINVFECDMYSKVKGRAARPTNLKEGGGKDDEILSDSEQRSEPKRKRVADKGNSAKKKQRKSVDSVSSGSSSKDTSEKSSKSDSKKNKNDDSPPAPEKSNAESLKSKSENQEKKVADLSTPISKTTSESNIGKITSDFSASSKLDNADTKTAKCDESSNGSNSSVASISNSDNDLPTFITKKSKTNSSITVTLSKPVKDDEKSSTHSSMMKSTSNKSRSSGGLFSSFMSTDSKNTKNHSTTSVDKIDKSKVDKQSNNKSLISKKTLDSVKTLSFSKQKGKSDHKSTESKSSTNDHSSLVIKVPVSNSATVAESSATLPEKDKLQEKKKSRRASIDKEEKIKSMKKEGILSAAKDIKKSSKIEKRSTSITSKSEHQNKIKDVEQEWLQQEDPFLETNLEHIKPTTNLFDLVDNDDRDYESFKYELEDVDIDEWDRQETERISQRPPPIELTNSEFKYAVKSGDYMKVEQALRSGCALNLENTDNTGMTLMMIAAQQGFDDIIETLSTNGAHINSQQKNGMTALMHACEHGHVCTVSLLLQLNAHANCVHSSTGETALMKAVKRGYKQITKLLLESGANFAANGPNDMTAAKLAKLMKNQDIHDMIVSHIKKLSMAFESQVNVTVNNAAKLLHPLFPIQCLAINESESLFINFKHELQPTVPGVGTLLFLAHTRIAGQDMKCRFQGSCAVKSVILNGVVQAPLTEDGNFVMTFSPLHNGKNELHIVLAQAQNTRVKLVVCAYKAHLTIPMPVC
ncbi:uncharacterized protein LOC141901387 isoform X2 [Tubulanus polymorphus]|uniref:uncharacterized protein LOC141901387 isoform X2 n=1 Tax=Tubulanus polymorphus TaxID=672921 RepID=UPI003DA1FA61